MDNSKSRLFIGIKADPNENLLAAINTHKSYFNSSRVRWTIPDNLHITLRFLGFMPEYYINSLSLMLDTLSVGFETFKVQYNKFGYFGDKKPRVFWLGLHRSEQLNILQQSITLSLEELGIKPEDRPFNPHLTIGRIKWLAKDDKPDKQLYIETKDIAPLVVNRISLFESISTPNGPIYKIIHSSELR